MPLLKRLKNKIRKMLDN